VLFKPNRPGYSDLAIDIADVQQAILDSHEFQRLAKQTSDDVVQWFEAHRDVLESITGETKPAELIASLGDTLLAKFKSVPLLDAYDVYEQLLTYWHTTMHDDVFLVMNDGWGAASKPRRTIEDKDRKLSETPDIVVGSGRGAAKYKMDLIPPSLIVARYFADEQAKIDKLRAVAEEAARAVEEYTEENAVEEGVLADAMEDDKISKALASARLREAKREGSDPDEIKALEYLVDLYGDEAAAKKAVKEAQAAVDIATLKKYGDLTDAHVRTIVLNDKWRATINNRIVSELHGLTLALVGRIKQLGQRYAETLDTLDANLAKFENQVIAHLADMGVE
jgi:type I restriction enzyme M protein